MVRRDSDRNMVPIDRANELVDKMRARFFSELPSERVDISRSSGRRLSADVKASVRSPANNISTMDGYAINTSDSYPLKLTGEVFAGDGRKNTLTRGETKYVATGAIVPEDSDAVLKIEEAVVNGGTLDGIPLEPWTNVIRAGADFEAGETILPGGTVVTPSAICILNAAGVGEVDVYRKIKVGVLSTGDEIKNGMTRDSNAPMVCAMLDGWGCEPEHLGVVPDDREETKAMLDSAASRFDMVVTIGGVSVGKHDYVASTIIEDGEVVFHGYRIRPGKPLLVSYYHGKPFFSLPGKPTGSFTAMELIVKRFVLGEARHPATMAALSRDIDLNSKGFDYVVYVQLKDGKAVPMGYDDSPLKLFNDSIYHVSVVSSSPRSIVSDGFFMVRDNVKAGQMVTVNLLN